MDSISHSLNNIFQCCQQLIKLSPKISIIIPVYNTEKYIARCLDSIKNQTYTDFEVVIVNDGSTDNSESICMDFALRDPRFRVYTKENGGNSSALNHGFQYLTGEYVTVVDSDDYIDERCFETLYEMSTKYSFDLLNFGHTYIKNDIADKRVSILPKNILIDNDLMLEYLKRTANTMLLWFNWSFFFRRAFLIEHNIKWYETLKVGNDTIFNLKCLFYSKATYSIDKPLYFYIYNPTSLTQQKYKKDLLENFIEQFNIRLQFYRENKAIDSIDYHEDIAQHYVEHSLFFMLNNLSVLDANEKHSHLIDIRNSVIYTFCFSVYKSSKYPTIKMRMIIYLFKYRFYRLVLFLLNIR